MGSLPLEVWVVLGVAAVMAVIRLQIGITTRRAAAKEVGHRHWASYTSVGLALAGVIGGMFMTGFDRSLLLSWLVGINLVAVAFYGWDKLAAWLAVARVPERSLHLLALAGGSIGAFLAQGVFHHKSKKTSFQLRFWGVVALQALLVWAHADTRSV